MIQTTTVCECGKAKAERASASWELRAEKAEADRVELLSALERATITLRVILGRCQAAQNDQERASVARVQAVIKQAEIAIAKAAEGK